MQRKLYSAFQKPHFTIRISHFTLHTAYSKLHTSDCTLCIEHFTLHTSHCTIAESLKVPDRFTIVDDILLIGWILPIGGASSVEGLRSTGLPHLV